MRDPESNTTLSEPPGRERAQLALLAEIGRTLSSALDSESTLRSVARLTVPALADFCMVDLVDEHGGIGRVATAHHDPSREGLTAKLCRFPPIPGRSGGVAEVLRTGEPLVVEAADRPALEEATTGPEHLGILDELGARSFLCVPLIARGHTLGAITLAYAESGRRYGEEDIAAATELAGHVALAVDNARLYGGAREEIDARKVAQEELDRERAFLQLLIDVTTAANEARSVEDALRTTLDRVRAHTGWPVGHAYRVGADGELVSTGIWSTDDPDRFGPLREITEAHSFPLGVGLPGRVLATRKAIAVEDVEGDPGILRARLASDLSVKGAFALPVLAGNEVVAVLEFFSGRPGAADELFLDVMAQVGTQLGRMSEREKARAALGRSEQLWRTTFESAPVGITHVGPDFRFLEANQAFCDFVGYEREELLERSIVDISHPDDEQDDVEQIRRLFAGEVDRYAMERRYVRQDGSLVWGQLTASLLRDADGTPLYQIGTVADITNQKRADEALRDSEMRFRQLAEHIHEVFWITDPEFTRMIYLSPAYEEIWGRPREQVYQDAGAWIESIVEEDRPRVAASAPRRSEGTYEEEYRIRRPDGEVRWILDRGFPVLGEGGDIVRMVGIAEDITAQKQAEEERARLFELEQEAREKAEDALQTRDDVLGMVSHDLRNPLNTIGMAAALLQDMALEPEQRERQLDVIRRTAEHMRRLVEGLLDLKRIEAGHGIPVDPAPVEVGTLLAEGCTLFEAQARAKGLRIMREKPDDVPPVRADFERILQVLWNLTGNAIKFTPEGGRVVIGAEPEGDHVVFSVSDTGPGIAPEEVDRLFDPYWQSKRTARLGTGLGLPISKAIVEAHDGRIWVNASSREGATFCFTLPVAR